MEDVKAYKGLEKRTHPRFRITFPALLRLSVMKEGKPAILELKVETVDISLEGVKLLMPGEAGAISYIEDAKEGRGVDLVLEIVAGEKRIKAVGVVRCFKTEESKQVTVGIHLRGMGRDDRRIWEDLVKSIAMGL